MAERFLVREHLFELDEGFGVVPRRVEDAGFDQLRVGLVRRFGVLLGEQSPLLGDRESIVVMAGSQIEQRLGGERARAQHPVVTLLAESFEGSRGLLQALACEVEVAGLVGEVGELDSRLDLHAIRLAGLGGEHGLAKLGLALVGPLEDPSRLPVQHVERGLGRQVVEPCDGGRDAIEESMRIREPGGAVQRARLRELALLRGDGRACGGILRQRIGSQQSGDVGAIGQRAQLLRGRGTAEHELLVGLAEQPDQRAQLGQSVIEARHPQRHHVLGLKAVYARGLARLGALRDPTGGVAIERLLGAGDRVVDERLVDPPERGLERRTRGGIPDAREAIRGIGTRRRCRFAGVGTPERESHRDQNAPRRDERHARGDPTTSRGRISAERGEQLVHRGEPLFGIERGRPQHDALDPCRDLGIGRRRRGNGAAFDQRLTIVRSPTVQGLVQRDTERELIDARIGGVPGMDLGRQVGRRAEHRAGHGQALGERALGLDVERARRRVVRRVVAGCVQSREPEVHHAYATVVADQHVVGLEVAMHQPDGVSGGEPGPRGAHHRHDLSPASRPLSQPRA